MPSEPAHAEPASTAPFGVETSPEASMVALDEVALYGEVPVALVGPLAELSRSSDSVLGVAAAVIPPVALREEALEV